MAALVRDHADDLIWRLCVHQRTGIDEHIVPVIDESVESPVIDDLYVDSLRGEAGGVEDWLSVDPNERFGLGVADEPCGLCGVSRGERNGETS